MSTPAAGRRQSTRQTRPNSYRPENYYARTFGRGATSGRATNGAHNNQPGFFPAITHFTDCVSALPKEVLRQISMLKEVEAKVHGPDEELNRLAEALPALPDPNANDLRLQQQRNDLLLQMCHKIEQMSPALEEKIVVLSTTNDILAKQIVRMESSYEHIAGEISEEARLGSLTHWAYVDKESKKVSVAAERPRRDVVAANNLAAAAAAVHEGDIAAARSEARREAVAARKTRKEQVDSDFDDRPVPKKTLSKPKKVAVAGPASEGKLHGLGIVAAPGATTKRRKVEKPTTGESAMSAALNGAVTGAAAGRGRGSPRETPVAESSKRKTKAVPLPAPLKKKAPAISANSPHLASSPLHGSFPLPRDLTSGTQRPTSSRARQHSHATSVTSEAPRNRPSTANRTSNLPSANTSTENIPAGVLTAPALSQKAPEDTKMEDASAQASSTHSLKREEAEAPEKAQEEQQTQQQQTQQQQTQQQQQQQTAAPRPSRASKTSTPVTGTFPIDAHVPMARSRSTRKTGTQTASHASSESNKEAPPTSAAATTTTTTTTKRSHKKKVEQDVSSPPASDADEAVADVDDDAADAEVEGDGEGEDGDEDGPRYCYCNQVSYGQMVGCDNENCPREWFHLRCVGLSEAPGDDEPWMCKECAVGMKGRK